MKRKSSTLLEAAVVVSLEALQLLVYRGPQGTEVKKNAVSPNAPIWLNPNRAHIFTGSQIHMPGPNIVLKKSHK